MTGTEPITTVEPPPIEPISPAGLPVTSMMALFGHLTWLGWMWAIVTVGYAIAIGAISAWGSLDVSLWQHAVAGWQRWPIGAAGLMMATVFGPMFVTNGVTRARLAQAAIVSMVVLAVLGSIYVTAGFAIESAVFDANDWPHRIDDTRWIDDVGLARIGLGFALVFAAYFVGGWVVGLAYQRFGWAGLGIIPVAAAPVMVCEIAVQSGLLGTQFDFLDRVSAPPLWAGTAISIAVTAVFAAGAARMTRELRIT